MRLNFFFEKFDILFRFQLRNENLTKRFSFFREEQFKWLHQILPIMKSILTIGNPCLKKEL